MPLKWLSHNHLPRFKPGLLILDPTRVLDAYWVIGLEFQIWEFEFV